MQHTYLYHVTREDHRHNFSIWFYQMYLGIDNTSPWMGLVAFVPQLALVTIIGIAFGKDLFFATFVQTFIFVTFNKVITSQVSCVGVVHARELTSWLLVFYVVYLLVPIDFAFFEDEV